MEVFTGSLDHTTKTEPEIIELDLKDKILPSSNDALTDILQNSPLPYTVTVAAAAKVNMHQKECRRINKMTSKNNKMKPAFQWPDILDLKHELKTLDTSKTRIFTQHHIQCL